MNWLFSLVCLLLLVLWVLGLFLVIVLRVLVFRWRLWASVGCFVFASSLFDLCLLVYYLVLCACDLHYLCCGWLLLCLLLGLVVCAFCLWFDCCCFLVNSVVIIRIYSGVSFVLRLLDCLLWMFVYCCISFVLFVRLIACFVRLMLFSLCLSCYCLWYFFGCFVLVWLVTCLFAYVVALFCLVVDFDWFGLLTVVALFVIVYLVICLVSLFVLLGLLLFVACMLFGCGVLWFCLLVVVCGRFVVLLWCVFGVCDCVVLVFVDNNGGLLALTFVCFVDVAFIVCGCVCLWLVGLC